MQFCDLHRQCISYKSEIDTALQDVLNSTTYIYGPQVAKLEVELDGFSGDRNAIACANGTDAVYVSLFGQIADLTALN